MAKRNASPGSSVRYDQIDALEERARQLATRQGVFTPFICPVCNKNRRQYKHDKCSKILQKQRDV